MSNVSKEPFVEYSICFPYCLRLPLLRNTLQSFREQYGYRDDFEISIVEDPKSHKEYNLLCSLLKEYSDLKIRLTCGDHEGISYLWNKSVNSSNGKYIILTSPEIRHTTDILNYFDEFFHNCPDDYCVIACKNVSSEGILLTWYQHSELHNRMLHFCSALSRKNWNKIGGFCELFDQGICYDDDDFLGLIKHAGIRIHCEDSVWAEHQDHPHLNWGSDRSILVARNKQLYLQREAERNK